MPIMASAAPLSTPSLPRVGIVAVSLPTDSEPLRWAWLDQDTLMVGFDPARLTRALVELILADRLGAYLDDDAEVTA